MATDPQHHKTLNLKATGVIALAVMCSRVLGLIREILFNALFGTSAMGIFLIAFRAPNLLRDLFAEGALSISFITVFAKTIEADGEQKAWALAAKTLTLTAIGMVLICCLGILCAKPFIAFLAPGFSTEDIQATALLTQIMYPFMLLVSLAAIVMGILNTKNIFGIPALASSFFNIGSILGGTLLAWLIDPTFGGKALIGLAIGTVFGGFLQLWIQIPSLRRVGFHFKPDFQWRTPGMHQILVLTLPAILAASAVQINVLVNSIFASYVGKAAVTWLNSAFRLMQFPLGMFGVAVATISLPVLSRLAAAKDHHAFGHTIGRALRLAIFLTLPAAVGLWFLAPSIIQLIYEHGKFTSHDTYATAWALQFYALGLVAYACIKVLSPGFYAIEQKWTPMTISLVSIVINVCLNYCFIFVWGIGHVGLALSTSIAASLNFIMLYICMAQQHDIETTQTLRTLLKCVVAATCLGGFCWYIQTQGTYWIHHASLLLRSISLCGAICIAGALYMSACLCLRVEIASEFLTPLRRRIIGGARKALSR